MRCSRRAPGWIYWKSLGINETVVGLLWSWGVVTEIVMFMFSKSLACCCPDLAKRFNDEEEEEEEEEEEDEVLPQHDTHTTAYKLSILTHTQCSV